MKDGYKNECKVCHNKLERIRYRSKPKSERYCKYKMVKKVYGLSRKEYDDLLKKAKYSCQICGATKRRLCVDHCHKSKEMKVRGILCDLCNSGIGKLGDTSEALLKAFLYLKENE
jgi:hypothetical protein